MWVVVEAFLLVVVCGWIIRWRFGGQGGRFPPGPPGLPIIGHLHLLRKLPHQVLAGLAKKHGPIMGLRVGGQLAVVVSSPQAAREILVTNDKVLAYRPSFQFCASLFYGGENDILVSSPGPDWRKRRRLCTLELVAPKRLRHMQHIRQDEVSLLLSCLRHAASRGATAAVDIGRCVAEMSANTISRMLQSRTLFPADDDDKDAEGLDTAKNAALQSLIKQMEHEMAPTVGDLFPYLKFMDFLRKRRMKHLHDSFDNLLDSIITERKKALHAHYPHDMDQLPRDFLHFLLSNEQGFDSSSSPADQLTMQEIKGIMMDVILGGIHTTGLTLEWAMAELLKNPNCLRRLQEEIDKEVGKGKQVVELDIPKLSYLKNVVKEVFRLHPAAPLLCPRVSSEACEVMGYVVPKNAQIYINVWAIGRDEQVWDNANAFLPHRFEGSNVDPKGQHFELLPFGSGRRVCLGLSLGLSIVEVTLANLVNNFDWELPLGETCDTLNMKEKTGITTTKAARTIAIPKPRQ